MENTTGARIENTTGAREEKIADLSTLGAGAAAEKFQAELAKVLDNIRDPNTDAKAKRKITLEYLFIPAEDRERVLVAIAARSSLPSTKPSGDVMYVGSKNGEAIGTVLHSPDGSEDPRQGILDIKTGKAGST